MTSIQMPQLGETIVEGTILKWLKHEGDAVARDEALFEISTDKVDTEVPSPVAGTVTKILVDEGATVPVGTIVMEVAEEGAPAAAAASAPAADAPAAAAVPAAEPVSVVVGVDHPRRRPGRSGRPGRPGIAARSGRRIRTRSRTSLPDPVSARAPAREGALPRSRSDRGHRDRRADHEERRARRDRLRRHDRRAPRPWSPRPRRTSARPSRRRPPPQLPRRSRWASATRPCR